MRTPVLMRLSIQDHVSKFCSQKIDLEVWWSKNQAQRSATSVRQCLKLFCREVWHYVSHRSQTSTERLLQTNEDLLHWSIVPSLHSNCVGLLLSSKLVLASAAWRSWSLHDNKVASPSLEVELVLITASSTVSLSPSIRCKVGGIQVRVIR